MIPYSLRVLENETVSVCSWLDVVTDCKYSSASATTHTNIH